MAHNPFSYFGPLIMMSQDGREGQKLPLYLVKKTTKRGGGGQKLPILRRHSLWTAPKDIDMAH